MFLIWGTMIRAWKIIRIRKANRAEMNSYHLHGTQIHRRAHLLSGPQSQAGLYSGADTAYSGPYQLTGTGPEGETTLLKSVNLSRSSLKIKGVLLGSMILWSEKKEKQGLVVSKWRRYQVQFTLACVALMNFLLSFLKFLKIAYISSGVYLCYCC